MNYVEIGRSIEEKSADEKTRLLISLVENINTLINTCYAGPDIVLLLLCIYYAHLNKLVLESRTLFHLCTNGHLCKFYNRFLSSWFQYVVFLISVYAMNNSPHGDHSN